jgi:hypothetical protein
MALKRTSCDLPQIWTIQINLYKCDIFRCDSDLIGWHIYLISGQQTTTSCRIFHFSYKISSIMNTSEFSFDHPIVLVIRPHSSLVGKHVTPKNIEMHLNGKQTQLTINIDGTLVCHMVEQSNDHSDIVLHSTPFLVNTTMGYRFISIICTSIKRPLTDWQSIQNFRAHWIHIHE